MSDIAYKPQLLMWGSGAVLDAEGNEIAKVRIESSGLTQGQLQALDAFKLEQSAEQFRQT